MRFVAFLPGHVGQSEPVLFDIYRGTSENRDHLMASWVAYAEDGMEPLTSEGEELVLLEGVRDIEFSYLDQTQTDSAGAWRDRWQERKQLPKLVRLAVIYHTGEEKIWPEFVALTMIDKDANCVFDPIAKNCRNR